MRPTLHLLVKRRVYSPHAGVEIVKLDPGAFFRHAPPPEQQNGETQTSDSATNPPMFRDVNLSILFTPAKRGKFRAYALVGPANSGKTTFLEILQGKHFAQPRSARTYPFLATELVQKDDPRLREPRVALEYVGFDTSKKGLSGMGTYLSARYESRREATDFSVKDYLRGQTSLNAIEEEKLIAQELWDRVVQDLKLGELLDMPMSNLSNGQTRRARIAKALLNRPLVLLLDEPFMGLDPIATKQLSETLEELAFREDPRLFFSLRPQDPIPFFITNVLLLGKQFTITDRGEIDDVVARVSEAAESAVDQSFSETWREFGSIITYDGITAPPLSHRPSGQQMVKSAMSNYRKGEVSYNELRLLGLLPARGSFGHMPLPVIGESLIEMNGVVVKYDEKVVLGRGVTRTEGDSDTEPKGLVWTVKQGERWVVIGPNGSGKTTLLSLILSDHPQAYSQPLKIFGRERLPSPGKPGISVFELQKRIGHASPEVHAFFPKHVTVRAALESAFAATPLSPPTLTAAIDDKVSHFLAWFQPELNPFAKSTKDYLEPNADGLDVVENWKVRREIYRYMQDERIADETEWADSTQFSSLSFTGQRIILFLRAIIAEPDIIILDEAFSGMDVHTRDKCLAFLEKGETSTQASFNVGLGHRGSVVSRSGSFLNDHGRFLQDASKATFTGITNKQALITVSHLLSEIPHMTSHWIYLPAGGVKEEDVLADTRVGRVTMCPLAANVRGWQDIWSGKGEYPADAARFAVAKGLRTKTGDLEKYKDKA